MYCNILVQWPEREIFALTVPEDVGSADGVVIPHARRFDVVWEVSGDGRVARTRLGSERAAYELQIEAGMDYVDATMTIANIGTVDLQSVWSFNCLSPVNARSLRDEPLDRTFLSRDGQPTLLSTLPRTVGPRANLQVYGLESAPDGGALPFVRDFQATNEVQADAPWLLTLSSDGSGYMAATSPEALFLFNNQKLSCLHSACAFGDIPAGESRTRTCRFYLTSEGGLVEFVERFAADRAALRR